MRTVGSAALVRCTRWMVAAACVAALGLRPAAASPPATFSASVERFEADGNVFGPAGGPLDFVDEFDGGTLAPDWSLEVGTAFESGGVLVLRDPGLITSLVPGLTLDVSDVESEHDLTNGAGDCTLTSYWTPVLPDTNRGIHFQTYVLGAAIEAAGLTLNNTNGVYTVEQDLTIVGDLPIPQHHDSVPIDPGDVTGTIVLRLSFDDATDMLSTSFSLDGGATFQSPFSPVHIFNVSGTVEILLGAESFESLPPPPPPSCSDTVSDPMMVLRRGSEAVGDEQLTFRGTLHAAPGLTFDPITDGAQVQVDFMGTSSSISMDAPPGGVGSGCGPRDGWTVRGTTYTYRNYTNLLPPACNQFGPGLTTLTLHANRISSDGSMRFQARIREAAIFNFPSTLSGTVRLAPTAVGGATACATTTLACQGTIADPRARCR